jgi:hypothetical protein
MNTIHIFTQYLSSKIKISEIDINKYKIDARGHNEVNIYTMNTRDKYLISGTAKNESCKYIIFEGENDDNEICFWLIICDNIPKSIMMYNIYNTGTEIKTSISETYSIDEHSIGDKNFIYDAKELKKISTEFLCNELN